MRTATAKTETVKCPLHVGVTMTPVKSRYPKLVGLMDHETQKKTRTILKCPVAGCPRVRSNAPAVDELEEDDEVDDGDGR
jgi:hypothetical protein